MRVDHPTTYTAFDNMNSRPITGTSDFTKYDVVLDFAADTVDFAFGVLLSGSGDILFGGPTFEVVDNSVPTTGGP
jgi:hypothetical protein